MTECTLMTSSCRPFQNYGWQSEWLFRTVILQQRLWIQPRWGVLVIWKIFEIVSGLRSQFKVNRVSLKNTRRYFVIAQDFQRFVFCFHEVKLLPALVTVTRGDEIERDISCSHILFPLSIDILVLCFLFLIPPLNFVLKP